MLCFNKGDYLMIRIITSITFFFIMISNITYGEIFKTSCIDEGDLNKSEYKMFQLQINRDNEKLKWADGGWRSFNESSFKENDDYIYWDTVTLIIGRSITYFYSKKKSILVASQFEFESKDYFGRQGDIYKVVFKCF